MEDFTETTPRPRRLMSLTSAVHLSSIVLRLAAAQLLLCQVVWLWPSWVLAVGSQSQQGSAWRQVKPWKDRIESPEQLLTTVGEAQPAQQVCVYFHSGSFIAGIYHHNYHDLLIVDLRGHGMVACIAFRKGVHVGFNVHFEILSQKSRSHMGHG